MRRLRHRAGEPEVIASRRMRVIVNGAGARLDVRERMHRLVLLAILAPSIAVADEPAATPPSATPPVAPQAEAARPERVLGVGYKLGNGIGFFGADVIISPMPHVSLDLYGTYVLYPASSG